MDIAFTGPRELSKQQEAEIYKHFCFFICTEQANWHVGDAEGLDNFVIRAYKYFYDRKSEGYLVGDLIEYKVTGKQKWCFAERSQRMINAIAGNENSWLYAFPNKLCPNDCSPKNPFSGHGSGTWGTIAYAKKKNVKIYLFPLFKVRYGDRSWLPDWMKDDEQKQLSLF